MLYLILSGLISIAVTPKTCFDPCTIRAVIRVEPAKDNERIVVEVDSESYYHSSDLDYTNGGPKLLQISYPDLPAGAYSIKATLHKRDAKAWVADEAYKKITILSTGGR